MKHIMRLLLRCLPAAVLILFNPATSVYVSYYVKFSANWQISDPNRILHEFYLLTNKDVDFAGINLTHLTVQNMLIQGRPLCVTRNFSLWVHICIQKWRRCFPSF